MKKSGRKKKKAVRRKTRLQETEQNKPVDYIKNLIELNKVQETLLQKLQKIL